MTTRQKPRVLGIKDRDGFVMGEGAGVLVLESLEHALARGAPIYAEYLGGAVNCDAYHMTDPREDGDGVALCMEEALAGCRHCQRSRSIISMPTPHRLWPAIFARSMRLEQVFGDHMRKNIKINATKSMIGHCLGAAGGIEAVATIKAIQTGMLHPTINLENPDPEIEGIRRDSKRSKSP